MLHGELGDGTSTELNISILGETVKLDYFEPGGDCAQPQIGSFKHHVEFVFVDLTGVDKRRVLKVQSPLEQERAPVVHIGINLRSRFLEVCDSLLKESV